MRCPKPGRDMPSRMREISESLTSESFASFWPFRFPRVISIWSLSLSFISPTITSSRDRDRLDVECAVGFPNAGLWVALSVNRVSGIGKGSA